jgi:hypothetical protein
MDPAGVSWRTRGLVRSGGGKSTQEEALVVEARQVAEALRWSDPPKSLYFQRKGGCKGEKRPEQRGISFVSPQPSLRLQVSLRLFALNSPSSSGL